jgi:hypothetical protein
MSLVTDTSSEAPQNPCINRALPTSNKHKFHSQSCEFQHVISTLYRESNRLRRSPEFFFSSPVAPPVQAIEPTAQQHVPLVPTVDPVAPVEAPPPPGNDIVSPTTRTRPRPCRFRPPRSSRSPETRSPMRPRRPPRPPSRSAAELLQRRGRRLPRAPRLSSMCLLSSTPTAEDNAVPPGSPHMPSSMGLGSPTTPPLSPRAVVHRRLLALGLPLSSLPSGGHGRRAEAWALTRPLSGSHAAPPTAMRRAPGFLETPLTRRPAVEAVPATAESSRCGGRSEWGGGLC